MAAFRTDDTLQSNDFVECGVGPDVENALNKSLSRRHGPVATARYQNDPVNLPFERVDPIRHELPIGARGTSIPEVLGIFELALRECSITHVVHDSQLKCSTSVPASFLMPTETLALVRPN